MMIRRPAWEYGYGGSVDVLDLRVVAQNSNHGLHAAWIEPRLLQKKDTPDK